MSRFRNYVFTMNNYPDTKLVEEVSCKYIVYGREVGASGTPHLQGFISFKEGKTESAVRKLLPGCHVEIAKTVEEAIEYCKKEGSFTERGVAPQSLKKANEVQKENWELILDCAKRGAIEEIPAEIQIKYDRALHAIADRESKKRPMETLDELEHEWYCGPAGTGKSRKAREENPMAYLKMANKWWDDYDGEEVIILEDFDKVHADKLVYHLKIWADRYPFRAEKKGGTVVIRPKKIIVTSNWHPEELWTDDKDLGPILRRFQITCFDVLPNGYSHHVEEKKDKKMKTTTTTDVKYYK